MNLKLFSKDTIFEAMNEVADVSNTLDYLYEALLGFYYQYNMETCP